MAGDFPDLNCLGSHRPYTIPKESQYLAWLWVVLENHPGTGADILVAKVNQIGLI